VFQFAKQASDQHDSIGNVLMDAHKLQQGYERHYTGLRASSYQEEQRFHTHELIKFGNKIVDHEDCVEICKVLWRNEAMTMDQYQMLIYRKTGTIPRRLRRYSPLSLMSADEWGELPVKVGDVHRSTPDLP
jgi:hypothetical protein